MERENSFINKVITASLLSEGEKEIQSSSRKLKVPFNKKKILYLSNLLAEYKLENSVSVQFKKGEFTIHSNALGFFLSNWYIKDHKIFSYRVDPSLIDKEAIIIAAILFGERKQDNISIHSSIHKDHLKTLCLCINKNINVPVSFHGDRIRIFNVKQFFMNVFRNSSTIHTAELVDFLTEQEKKEIKEGSFL
ncbi:hypothetical protein ACTQ5K_06020 [Niallia sp. Sow4_A1]|uniref:hypothetical protein n=1 Tax=Niallia sp. Sow4_A1 TaxID=3438793 RepID=UPI003F985FBF